MVFGDAVDINTERLMREKIERRAVAIIGAIGLGLAVWTVIEIIGIINLIK